MMNNIIPRSTINQNFKLSTYTSTITKRITIERYHHHSNTSPTNIINTNLPIRTKNHLMLSSRTYHNNHRSIYQRKVQLRRRGSIPQIFNFNTKSSYQFSTNHDRRKNDRSSSDEALMNELGRLTSRQTNEGPTLGPFMMPRGARSERPLEDEEMMRWNQVGWMGRIKRSLRIGRNLIVVGFGGSLGILIVYSIISELFAPTSPTNLMSSAIEILEESEDLKKILKPPYKFSTTIQNPQSSSSTSPSSSSTSSSSSSASSPTSFSKRTNGVPQMSSNLNGSTILRFQIESNHSRSMKDKDLKLIISRSIENLRDPEWWKGLIVPLITSEAYQPQSSSSSTEKNEKIQGKNDKEDGCDGEGGGRSLWWILPTGLMKSLMPLTVKSLNSKAQDNHLGWSSKNLPSLGTFERGEVFAEFIKNERGSWKFKSLMIDFPDSNKVRYRMNVLERIRIQRSRRSRMIESGGVVKEEDDDDERRGFNRFRFWSRRVQI